jgi:ABC-type polysaccharide/polyol phosphate transport system ATPase subunit
MKNAIELKGVWKKFKRGRKLLLKEALLDVFKPASTEDFWALKDINLKIKKGETVGIIGPNGSGKSTILKLIAGVMYPTKGSVKTKGNIAPLIELGAGFHPELSGRENIYLNGTILGLSKGEIEKQFDEIVEFSELHDFIDTPIKHYSSGMQMRLGFSVAVHTNPEILLVDEILAVGDVDFQKKSFNKMKNFKKENVTIIYVSHNLESISTFCEKAVYLKSSEIVTLGEAQEVVNVYSKQHNK